MKKTPLQYALDMISLRDRSEFELHKKMVRKEYSEEEIATTIEWLKDKKFLNDERFAEHFIKYQMSLGRVGKQKIKLKLYQLGVAEDLINKYLNDQGENELENAQIQAQKWLVRSKITDKYEQKNKLFRFLLGRGFNYDIIIKATEKLK
ncbi:MAG: regulatory protein RecX [bacterium]